MAESKFVDGFLNEIKAALYRETGDTALRLTNAERLLQLEAERLAAEYEVRHIRVLTDRYRTEKCDTLLVDYLVQIDDYDVRIKLLDAPEGEPKLKSKQLAQYRRFLVENPNTAALILTWITDELLSIPISLVRISYLEHKSVRLDWFLGDYARPLLEALSTIIERQEKAWTVEISAKQGINRKVSNYPRIFGQAFERAIEQECGRPFRKPMRKVAAQTYDLHHEKRVIMKTFEDAMSGRSSKTLETQLTRILGVGRE
jgi:hypothetical protein